MLRVWLRQFLAIACIQIVQIKGVGRLEVIGPPPTLASAEDRYVAPRTPWRSGLERLPEDEVMALLSGD